MGIIYPSRGLENKTTSVFGEVLVRDPSTYKVLPDGEEGLLQFISPMPFSYLVIQLSLTILALFIRVMMKIQIYLQKFEITGRAKNAEIRGCGDIMSSYVKVDTKKIKKIIAKSQVCYSKESQNRP